MFSDEDSAAECVKAINGRIFAGKPVHAELSPVTDFKEAQCRQYATSLLHPLRFCFTCFFFAFLLRSFSI
jgi:hypothetical protein